MKRLAFAFLVLAVCVAAVGGSAQAWHGEICAKSQSAERLENTYWKLVELNGKPIAVASQQREPHLRFNPEEKSLNGSGGCNTIRGSYQMDGEELRFTQIATTRMACPNPYMSQESNFLKALEAVNAFKISGDKLELYCDDGLLMRFEARYT